MKKNKKIAVVIAIIAVLLLAVAGFLSTAQGGTGAKLNEKLDLGNRYLTEQNYEEAVAAFLVAIDIDPKCAEAYIGAADAYIGMNDYDSAIAILQQGYEATGDESISQKLTELQTKNTGNSQTQDNEPAGSGAEQEETDLPYVEFSWDYKTINYNGVTVMEDGVDELAAKYGLSFDNLDASEIKVSDDVTVGIYLN